MTIFRKGLIRMTYYKTICDLNYRTGPGIKYSKVGVLKKGAVVNVAEIKSNWAKFESNKKYYYCSLKYLKKANDYGAIVAKEILPMAKKVVSHKAAHTSGNYTYTDSKVNCSVFVSAILQKAGILPEGVTIYHTSKNHKKTTLGNIVHNRLKVDHYTWHKTNAIYKKLPDKYKKRGCVYVYASSMAILEKSGYIYGCHSTGSKYTKLSMIKHTKNTYEFTSPILAVGVPNIE